MEDTRVCLVLASNKENHEVKYGESDDDRSESRLQSGAPKENRAFGMGRPFMNAKYARSQGQGSFLGPRSIS